MFMASNNARQEITCSQALCKHAQTLCPWVGSETGVLRSGVSASIPEDRKLQNHEVAVPQGIRGVMNA